jgi:multidrug efflux pump subunit AcrB
LQGKIEELNGSLPSGYKIVVGGAVEESAKSEDSVMAVMPVVLILFMATLMIQLENFKHLILVLSVAPLGLIGVVFALRMTGQPLGFVALLGIVALIGMIVRNSVNRVSQDYGERFFAFGKALCLSKQQKQGCEVTGVHPPILSVV